MKTLVLFGNLFLLFAYVLSTTSCNTDARSHHGLGVATSELAVVVTIDGGNVSIQRIIRSELNKHGIECVMEGSVAYDVLVPKPLAKKARKILLESKEIKREWLLFPPAYPPTTEPLGPN